jgi:D-aminopeptidase
VLADDDRGDGAGAIDALFQAVVEATEEAVLNSLFVAETTVGRDGHVSAGLPVGQVCELVRAAGGR